MASNLAAMLEHEVSKTGTSDLLSMTAIQLAQHYEKGDVSPVEVLDAVLKRASDAQGALNAFTAFDLAGAMTAAKDSETRWRQRSQLSPLDGVPVSVKDNIYTARMPTRFGSLAIPEDQTRGPDSPSVACLRKGGAVVFGKTTLCDYAHKIVTDSPLTGVTRNPWDPSRTPGGSSGGAAAAVAAGIGPLAVGSDGGGSIRIPSTWSGIYGLKPSFGRVPHFPRGAFAPVSHIGPMTRSVADAALMLEWMSCPDGRDWYSLPYDGASYTAALKPDLKGLRFAFSQNLGRPDLKLDPDIAAAVRQAAKTAEQLGALVEEADPPCLAELADVARICWFSYSAYLAAQLGAREELLDPSLRALVALGRDLKPLDITRAQMERSVFGGAINSFFERYDLLIGPVIDRLAPRLTDIDPLSPPVPTHTTWCNLTGLPAASLPMGLGASGLPVGIQIVGRRFDDAAVLRASFAFEQSREAMPKAPRHGY